MKSRIICDYYWKGPKNIQENHPEVIAIHDIYEWLYNNGILMKEASVAKDYDTGCHFCLNAAKLEPYRQQMLDCGIMNAALAVEILLDRPIAPCRFTGSITLSGPMASYRSVDGIVSSSWECYMIQFFDIEGAMEVYDVLQRDGAEAAVAAMFGQIPWKEIEIQDPDELRCSVCNCWLASREPNGVSYASSHYNGTDICDDCMVEHCLATNCLGCTLGNYPDCQFLPMKKSYQEDENN